MIETGSKPPQIVDAQAGKPSVQVEENPWDGASLGVQGEYTPEELAGMGEGDVLAPKTIDGEVVDTRTGWQRISGAVKGVLSKLGL